MAAKKAKKPQGPVSVRGGGIGDIGHLVDFATKTESFIVDTFVNRNARNGRRFDAFIASLQSGEFSRDPAVLDRMIAFLDSEVEQFTNRLPSEQLRAKNMFRAAFGRPSIVPGAAPTTPRKKRR